MLMPVAIWSLMLSTILLRNKEHGGVIGECHSPSKRTLFIYSRSGGGISTIKPKTCKIKHINSNKKISKIKNHLLAKHLFEFFLI
jgi:hypothetical protein